MKVQLVSHASAIFSLFNTKVIVDPWLKGSVFNDSWDLIAPSAEVNWQNIDYIYITHEHPDHFHFPTLRSIPEDEKKRMKVLLSFHSSPRLKSAIEKLGFSVRELPLNKWVQVGDFDILTGSVGSMDNFIAFRGGGKTALNMNDCVASTRHHKWIKGLVGKVDLLLTQFSFANWVGNFADEINAAERKISEIKRQISIYEPAVTVPFASFVYFSAVDNARQNAWANTPRSLLQHEISNLTILRFGEVLDLSSPHSTEESSLIFYDQAYQNLKIKDLPPSHSQEELSQVIKDSLNHFCKKIPYLLRKKIRPLSIWIADLNKGVALSFSDNSVDWDIPKNNCDYEMHSQRVFYFFRYSWGPGTIEIAGTYLTRPSFKSSRYQFYQNFISTEWLNLWSVKGLFRTFIFIWKKKAEIIYRLT